MKLEVGKKYRTRDGQEVVVRKATRDDGFDIPYEFVGTVGTVGHKLEAFTDSGRFYYSGADHRLDIVSEITDQPTSITRHIALVQRKGRYKVRAFKSRELAQADPTYQSGVDVTLYL